MISKAFSYLGKKTSLALSKVVPGWADSRIDALLMAPKPRDSKTIRVPKEFKQHEIKSLDGTINAYRTGSGPTVVFVHGWGGAAYQFFPLMRGLTRCGFSALAFDHLGHGQSERKPTTLQQSIATTNFVLHQVSKSSDGLAAVVGHSTGCIAIANARNNLLKDLPLFLIAPIFNYRLFFLKRLVKLDLHSDLLKKYATRFARAYKHEYQKLELARNLDKYGDTTVIAHDRDDPESPLSDSVAFCKKYPLTKLLVTRQCDHLRIINSESVWQELKSHLNYDDTTINFAEEILDTNR